MSTRPLPMGFKEPSSMEGQSDYTGGYRAPFGMNDASRLSYLQTGVEHFDNEYRNSRDVFSSMGGLRGIMDTLAQSGRTLQKKADAPGGWVTLGGLLNSYEVVPLSSASGTTLTPRTGASGPQASVLSDATITDSARRFPWWILLAILAGLYLLSDGDKKRKHK